MAFNVRFSGLAVGAAVVLSLPARAQERVDEAAIEKIKAEGLQRSQVMETASWLTDVFGARLTGSPNIKSAGEWAAKKLTEWGAVNAKLEPWGYFGRGWTNDRLSLHVISPTPWPVIAYAAAWTPGTNGTVTGEVVRVEGDSMADLAKYRGKLRNAFVMLAPKRELNPRFTADAERYTEAGLDSLEAPPAARAGGAGRGGRGGGRGGAGGAPSFTQLRAEFLASEGVAAIIQPGSGNSAHGTVFTGGAGSRDPKNPTKTLTLILAPEHYNRIARIIEKGTPVRMEADVKNTFHDQDLNAFNIVADLPGTDPKLKDELVMLGAHFDSWHAGTGATDNAAGSAVMMEAMRILKATGLPLKRTVRIGLWTGEENGLLGSRAYVRNTFGSPADTTGTAPVKPAYEKFSGYFNVDNGTGKIRGVYLQGNAAVGPIFTEWMKPFNSMGTGTVTIRNTGGTDHGSFDAAGLPGWQFIQDEVEYGSRTHHSNMDVFDRLVADDMKHNATIVAAFVYLAANRDEKLPRKTPPRAVQ
ncbi:MAG TPA: M20/M25/M40 family metallo-hydrolase [Gemmatimonadaceae bacterium]|nr:M20/M25/M40 family metallo-hydrolase [Gemmatimonadaceae bacterium]